MTSVTVLRVKRGRLATKRWAPHPVTGKPELHGFDAGTWFSGERVEVADIRALSTLLTRLERDPSALIIRGEPLPDVNLRRVRRLKHRRKSGNNEVGPFFREPPGGLPFMLVDFDEVEVPAWVDPVDDPEAAAECLVGLLPEYFQDVTYHWQLSSSAGMGGAGTLSAHVWFWLDRLVTEAELTAWGRALPVHIDLTLFRTVQPHYTAAPIFDSGVIDPLSRRSGLRVGLADSVTLPAIDLTRARYATATTGGGFHWAKGFDAKLELLGDGDGLRGFRNPLLAASAAYVYEFGAEGTDAEALKARLRQAIDAAPKGDKRLPADIAYYASDEFLDELIGSAAVKYGTARAEREAEEAAQALPPHWPTAPLALVKAIELLDATVSKFFDRVLAGERPRTGIKAAAGMGKTRAVIGELARRPDVQDLNIEVYTPDHKLAGEWYGNLIAAAPALRVLVLRGRNHTDVNHLAPLCARAEMAEAVAKAGEPVYETLCERKADSGGALEGIFATERCPHFEACSASGYLAQFADRTPAVRIMAQAYLSLPRGELLPKPDLVVVDERFWPEAIYQRDIGLDRLTVSRPARQNGHGGHAAMMMAFALADHGKLVHDALLDGAPLLAAMRAAGHTRETLNRLARAEYATVENLGLSPSLPDAQIRRKLDSVNKAEVFARAALWRILRDEIDTGRDEAHGVELRRDVPGKNGERQHRVHLHRRKPLPRIANTGVLLLDADLEMPIASKLVPELEVVEIAVERRAEVIQVRDTRCSKRRLLGLPKDATDKKRAAKHIEEIVDLVAVEAAGGKRVLVVTYLPVRRRLIGEEEGKRLPPGAPLKNSDGSVEVAHFGGIRGQNRWRDFDTVVIIGRHQPPPAEAEALARAFYFDRAEPLTFLRLEDGRGMKMAIGRRGYRLRDGRHADADVELHPDPDVQLLLEQLREAESAQAVDRIRLVHADKPKRVIVASSLPLDLTVDRLVRWLDVIPSRLKVVGATAAAVPLSPRELARCFPDTWPSADAADSELKRLGLTGVEPLINYLLEVRPPLNQVEYHRPGVPGPAMRALVSGPVGRLKETLESVIGPVSSFRPVPAAAPHTEAAEPAVKPNLAPGDPSFRGEPLPADEAFAERSAIVESLAGVCRDIAEAYARLDPERPPGDIPLQAWVEIIDAAGRFMDGPMLANALALGWTPHDLFGCNGIRPFARIDQSGLLLELGGGRVIAMTETQAVIELPSGSRQSWQRRQRDPARPLIWQVAAPQRRAVG